jgi:hypothetical protein
MAYDQATANEICRRLAEGESLRSICRDKANEMPSHSQVLEWARVNDHFANQYARAREIGDEVEFEGLEELADETPERDDKGRVDPGWVAWQRGRIDVRKWTLARKRPKKYGDKLELAGDPDRPLAVTAIELVAKRRGGNDGSMDHRPSPGDGPRGGST